MTTLQDKAAFLWSIADLIRDNFNRGTYKNVIVPFTMLRRIDIVLEPTRQHVLECYHQHKNETNDLDSLLRNASRLAFYNTSCFSFARLLEHSTSLANDLRFYIKSFSPNMRDVLAKFDIETTIRRLDEAHLLYKVIERFTHIDLHPDRVPNEEMGRIFEELLRRFNEAANENPGEHFTPREVIHLMVNLMMVYDQELCQGGPVIRKIYDPCCGTGGMLMIAKQHILERNPHAIVSLYGQEVNPETYAICKADLFLSSNDGSDAERILFGSTLANDLHRCETFDYLLANPPYGKDWKSDAERVLAEAQQDGLHGRFGAGLPRISDGQLLFLQQLLARMHDTSTGTSRVAIVMNGSPLFTGDAGSGESEIRRWVLENDWLDAIVALPEQLFYNTGISTYIWVLSNRKQPTRRSKVQLIDATSLWVPMRKSLGDKRRKLSLPQIEQITAMYRAFTKSEQSKIFDYKDFGYRKITIERPMRLTVQVCAERLERLKQERAFVALAHSKKKDAAAREHEEAAGQRIQESILATLALLPDTLYKDCRAFEHALDSALKDAKSKIAAFVRVAILAALSERDETAAICHDNAGNPQPDPRLRDTENVPLTENVGEFFACEIKPHVPDAWLNQDIRDERDGDVGKVGYEIDVHRSFSTYTPPRPLAEIEADIKELGHDMLALLHEVAG
jgi:type I restriction enzyme M protein